MNFNFTQQVFCFVQYHHAFRFEMYRRKLHDVKRFVCVYKIQNEKKKVHGVGRGESKKAARWGGGGGAAFSTGSCGKAVTYFCINKGRFHTWRRHLCRNITYQRGQVGYGSQGVTTRHTGAATAFPFLSAASPQERKSGLHSCGGSPARETRRDKITQKRTPSNEGVRAFSRI